MSIKTKKSTLSIMAASTILLCSLVVIGRQVEIFGVGQVSYASRATIKDGWFKAGNAPQFYEIGEDQNVRYSGASSLYLFSTSERINGFGTIMKVIQPGEYLGKRVRMSAYIKAENVTRWTGMWMRVDGESQNDVLAFDNMQNRPISGTVAWKRYEIVLDVPQNAIRIAFGVLTDGPGKVWLDDLRFEIVDAAQTGSSTAFIAGSMMGSSQTKVLAIGGDFENPTDWYPTILPETRQYTAFKWDDQVFHAGSHSLSIAIGPFHPSDRQIAYNWTKAVPGFQEEKSYELTGWVRTQNLKGPVWICVQCWDAGRSQMLEFATTETSFPVSGTSDWTKVGTVFTVPAGTAEVRIRAGIAVPENIGGQVWFDDIEVRELR